jgi:hypothetical protein
VGPIAVHIRLFHQINPSVSLTSPPQYISVASTIFHHTNLCPVLMPNACSCKFLGDYRFTVWQLLSLTLEENMVKKNRSHFPIAVLLTTLICSHQTIAYLFFWFNDCNFEIMGACNTQLERFFSRPF